MIFARVRRELKPACALERELEARSILAGQFEFTQLFALPEAVMARPTGVGRADDIYIRMPIEGAGDWLTSSESAREATKGRSSRSRSYGMISIVTPSAS